jgi:hypothetical protein
VADVELIGTMPDGTACGRSRRLVVKWILLGHLVGGSTLFGAHVYAESLMAQAVRTTEPGGYMLIMLKASSAADRLMGVASLLTLVFGIWLVVDTHWEWGDLFVSVGLAAIIGGFAIAQFLMSPRLTEVKALIEEHGPSDERAIAKMKSYGNLIHVLTLIIAVAFVLMVLKPGS